MLKFDELNKLTDRISRCHLLKKDEKLKDDIGDILVYAYCMGVQEVGDQLGFEPVVDYDRMDSSVNKKVAGETYQQRVDEYIEMNDVESLNRVVETEFNRVFNESEMDTAKQGGAKYKTWVTMMDEKVRDTHSYLEGMTIPYDALFYTYDGDSAPAPGGFNSVENNANCRCKLKFSM